MICILTAGKTLTLAAGAFTLAWTHSVEKTRWQEHWTAGPEGLTVTQGAIEGSGAGMDPPPDAVLKDGAYVYTPHVPAIPELVLAASGATGAGWTLCPVRRGETAPTGFGAAPSHPRGQADPVTGAASADCLRLGTERQAPIHVRWCPAEQDALMPGQSGDASDAAAAAKSDPGVPALAAAPRAAERGTMTLQPARRPPPS